ncbi:MAG: alanine dehydrogenase [Gammaproteobacteria bacterium]|nr:alanine dehydrogenase [Gammaproteobacteria bacterium]
MRIGVPKEIKTMEGRVALIPPAVGELVAAGHEVFVETGAGIASGYSDENYQAVGAHIVGSAAETYGQAQLMVKVKEPVAPEYDLLREDHILFSFLHLAANATLTQALATRGLTAVAFETISVKGRLPLLAPMSDIAGRLASQIGTTLLHSSHGGRGILLGGLPAAERGNVVILGDGVAGSNAARVAANVGANVTVFGLARENLSRVRFLGPNVTALPSYDALRQEAVQQADLLIGAVLIPGAKAPHLVSREMVKSMKPGSVIIDISVDQGGCIETTRPTDYAAPTYVEEGVVHFGVTNMPGAVPRTASQALSAELTPFVLRLAAEGGLQDPVFAQGINVQNGKIVHPAVAQALQ